MPQGDVCAYCGLAWYKAGRWIVAAFSPQCDHETLDGRS